MVTSAVPTSTVSSSWTRIASITPAIGEAQLAVNWEAYPEDIAPLIHAHPTQNEALGEAFLALAGKPLHAI